MDVDVVVVGAGPAGCAAALAVLRACPGADVLLLDRDPPGRDKVCGDGLAPHALDVLRLPGLLAGHPPVADLSVGLHRGAGVRAGMRRPGYVIPRADLDARLLAAATVAGARFERHRVREVEQAGSAVDVDGRWRASVVIGADGVRSAVRRAVAPPHPRARTAVAIRGYAPVVRQLAGEQRIVLAPGGGLAYAWSFPTRDGTANVGYGEVLDHEPPTRGQLLARLDALLPGASRGGERWRGALLPLSTSRPRQPDGRVLLAGDAASLVNPLTGEGITYAVTSGELAGRAAVGWLRDGGDPGRRYRRALRSRLGGHLHQTSALAPVLRSPRATSAVLRAARDPRVFDDLVELGLGDGTVTIRTVVRTLRELARGDRASG